MAPIRPGRPALDLIFEELFGHLQIGVHSLPLFWQLASRNGWEGSFSRTQEEAANSDGQIVSRWKPSPPAKLQEHTPNYYAPRSSVLPRIKTVFKEPQSSLYP